MTLPLEQFGRDHWSTLLYLETVCVDADGRVDRRRMRCNINTHPAVAHQKEWNPAWGSRQKDGTVLPEHDDWDCAEDLERAGFLMIRGTAMNPHFTLMNLGEATAGVLRQWRADKQPLADFEFKFPENPDRAGWFIQHCEEGSVCTAMNGAILVFNDYTAARDRALEIKDIPAGVAEASVPALLTMLAIGEMLVLPKSSAYVYNTRVPLHGHLVAALAMEVPLLDLGMFEDGDTQAMTVQLGITEEEKKTNWEFFHAKARAHARGV